MSGGGQNTVTTQSGPPAQFLQAYQNVVGQAQNVAGTPYQQYSGNLVAPLSPDTMAGISQVEGSTGIAAPYINSAAQYINNATQPILTPGISGQINANSGQAVQQATNSGVAGINGAASAFNPSGIAAWTDPFTSSVVNATQAEFNNQNAQAQSQLAGNAASQGAWGGDRSAVAQGILAGQQQLAQAPTIANLENTGYQTALGALQNQTALGLQGATAAGSLGVQGAGTASQLGQQGANALLGANEAQGWLNSQAGYGMANLGQEALGTTLTGANALLGTGSLEQQQAQQELNIPYEQYLATQAYPFQTTGWLANVAEGLGSSAGGTGSTTYPSPSTAGQVLGAGLTGAGILGATGAFGSNGWLTGAGGLFGSGGGGGWTGLGVGGVYSARGGAIPHRAVGGILPEVPDVSISVVPGAEGMGVPPSHGGHNLMSTSTGSTTTTDSSPNVLGGLLDVAALASHFFANGGNVLPFRPRQHGGIAPANDDWPDEPMRAAGGGAPISVTTMPGSYAGSPGVPQLVMNGAPGGGTGIAASTSTGPASVTNYLADTANSASHTMPTVYTPPAAPAAPTQQSIEQMVQRAMQQQQLLQQQQDQGNGFYGSAHGGTIPHRDSGGDVPPLQFYDWDKGQVSPAASDSPDLDATMQALRGQYGDPGVAPSTPAAPAAPAAPIGSGAPTPAPGGGLAGDILRDPAAAPPSQGDAAAAPPQSGIGPSAASPPPSFGEPSQVASPSSTASDSGDGIADKLAYGPWGAAVQAGLGMMASRSPFPGVAIGQGGEAGLQALETIPQREQQRAAGAFANYEFNNLRGMESGQGGIGPAAPSPPGAPGAPQAPNVMVVGQNGQPLFNFADQWRQAWGMTMPGMPQNWIDAGKTRLNFLESLLKQGVMPTSDGRGVIPIQGAQEAVARQAGLTANAQAGPKIAESIATNASRPTTVKPGENVTTGFSVLPPGVQQSIQGYLAGPYGGYANRLPAVENNTGNPAARNPASSATGDGQFIDGTWLQTARELLPQATQGMSDQQLLALRSNPALSRAMTAAYAQENAPAIEKAGFPVNGASLYLAHHFGASGAVRIMDAPQNTPMSQLFGPDVIGPNRLRNMTAGQVVRSAVGQFGTQPIGATDRPQQIAQQPPQGASSQFQPQPSPAAGVPNPTTALPLPPPSSSFAPPRMVQVPGGLASSVTPADMRMQAEIGKFRGDAPARITALTNTQAQLVNMHEEVQQMLAQPGILQSGTAGQFRTNIVKGFNTLAQTLGLGQPIDPTGVANNEAFNKNSNVAAFTLARSLSGGRVAVGEVLQANRSTPNQENSPYGNVVVTNLLAQENMRQLEREKFMYQAAENNADPQQAANQFDAANPASKYVVTALATSAGEFAPQQVQVLRQHPNAAMIRAFDGRWGQGTAEYLLRNGGGT